MKREYKGNFIDANSEHGRSTMYVPCPFCGEDIEVYIWSFYGCGKRCSCGALLSPHSAEKEEAKDVWQKG